MGRGHRGNVTPQDLLLPEGKLIRTTRGGPNALKQLLLDLKKYSFSGYVRTVRSSDGRRSEGIVLLRGGNPEASLYQRADSRDRGRAALKKVWQDSYDEACVLELHARVDMAGLVHEYADAVLERPSKVVKKTKVPHTMGRTEIEKQLRGWRDRGYDVSSVEAHLDSDPAVLTASVLAMREAVKKAEAVETILDTIDVTGFESRAALLRERLRNPLRHPDIDAEVESLRDAIESMRRVEARRQIEVTRERDSEERSRKVVEFVMRQTENLRPESAPTPEEVARVLREPTPLKDEATGLAPSSTFEDFVEGESNRFAHGAAVAVAKSPAKAYNPLLITSGPGLGKTHLLHAIGNYIESHSKDAKVRYMTCEGFATSLEEARAQGTIASFRERVRSVDCLLLDDIQFLSSMPEIHEEIFYTFNDLHDGDRQIVLASDRAPKAIPNLDERLVSRFESGLVAGIEPPELATRIAILERRARDAKVTIDREVLSFIATTVEDNVRELGGAFNRVVAFSSLMDRPISSELAREVLSGPKEDTASPKAASAPSVVDENRDLQPGRSYLIEEDRPAVAFRLFARFLGGRSSGLVITRTNPKRVRETVDVSAGRILWLTDREGSAEETIAPALERIVYEIEDFMSKHPRGAVLLDGIEYLVSNNSFDAVLKFVRRLLDAVSESHYAFIISLGAATLKEQELKTLEREMDVIRAAEPA
ncbi:MAG TPA: DnaA/Hda family protein [Thermoplasmata archaeon]|nr:DnaA/Hda family protein [Thermoplasmata archaeon]